MLMNQPGGKPGGRTNLPNNSKFLKNSTQKANGAQMPTQNHLQREQTIKEFAEKILSAAESTSTKGFFNKDWWYGRIMDWSMKNNDFKTRMFRFVDVLPTLNSSHEISKHLKEYFDNKGAKGVDLTKIFNVGVGMGSLAPGLMAKAIKKNIQQMAKIFITGTSPEDALPVLKKSRNQGIGFTVDLLGEATLSESEAQDYYSRYSELIQWLSKDSESWKAHSILDQDDQGEIPKVNVSVKLTALYSQIKETDWSGSIETLKDRLRPLFKLAKDRFVFINLDMESFKYKDMTIKVFKELLLEPDFLNYPHFGIVMQAYLRDSFNDIQDLIQFAKNRQTPFSVRLVKGAYWDYENIHSHQKNWPIPVYINKKESDANYEKCAQLLIASHPHIKVALASHNVRSLAASLQTAKEHGLAKNAVEIQMLYGMADEIKAAFVKEGYRVREYATVGELIPGMAYLVRRLLENTSNESFLKSKFADGESLDKLLVDPADGLVATSNEHKFTDSFINEPNLDFCIEKNRQLVEEALTDLEKTLPTTVPIILNGQSASSDQVLQRENPSRTNQIVTTVNLANKEHAYQAVELASRSFKLWSETSIESRAILLDKVAELILLNRFKLIATEVLEVGKTWAEADGDITEAIDFCRYYANQMREIGEGLAIGAVKGETSFYKYSGRGVAAIIAPWNFPLAILAGMTLGNLVTGNPVIIKPAEQSSLVGFEFFKILQKAGFPKEVIHFLPGKGDIVGASLVEDSRIATITFTGSKDVGLDIIEKSGKVNSTQLKVKKAIIEMGGKNSLLIDNDADLDEAVQGTIYSAFAFQGQKCSACSRVIVLEEVYDTFLTRLIEATKSIAQLESKNPKAFLGPVVDVEAKNKILNICAAAEAQGQLAYKGQAPEGGHFVPPHIFKDVKIEDPICQIEIFGPVLTVIKAKNIEQAVEFANQTEYGLTGGAYSRSPGNIEYIKANLNVGNIYINRTITGAMVNRHPFGGGKMSGVGYKTGGPDYLKQFMEAKVITENTMRRGFAPEEESV